MNAQRALPTSAAVRYDRALCRGLKRNPPSPDAAVPLPTAHWPPENIIFLERYRDWLIAGGSSEEVIDRHRIPMAGHVLGLALKVHSQLNLSEDFDKAMAFIEAKVSGEAWKRNCRHSLRWFRRFIKEERGLVIMEKPPFGNGARYKAGLPAWLIESLTKYLHIRQANWRPARMAQATYQFWYKSTRIWRWLFTHAGIQVPGAVTRDQLFRYIDEQLVAGYKVSTINHDLHTFQGTLRFLQRQGVEVPHALLTLPGLKKPQPLPRFLTDTQVAALRDDLVRRVEVAGTAAAERNSRLDLAAFYLLWQSGIRVSELEDLRLADVDFEAALLLIREAKGLKDRTVYLTMRVIEALRHYLELRGPALSDHLFIYRHKPLSKDLIRCRMRSAGERLGFKVTPHMLRHTFGTQLLNGGAKITTIQRLLGHQRLNTTLLYARVHDQTVADDYFRAMAVIENRPGKRGDRQRAARGGHRSGQPPADQRLMGLVNKLEASGLADEQLEWLAELRAAL